MPRTNRNIAILNGKVRLNNCALKCVYHLFNKNIWASQIILKKAKRILYSPVSRLFDAICRFMRVRCDVMRREVIVSRRFLIFAIFIESLPFFVKHFRISSHRFVIRIGKKVPSFTLDKETGGIGILFQQFSRLKVWFPFRSRKFPGSKFCAARVGNLNFCTYSTFSWSARTVDNNLLRMQFLELESLEW